MCWMSYRYISEPSKAFLFVSVEHIFYCLGDDRSRFQKRHAITTNGLLFLSVDRCLEQLSSSISYTHVILKTYALYLRIILISFILCRNANIVVKNLIQLTHSMNIKYRCVKKWLSTVCWNTLVAMNKYNFSITKTDTSANSFSLDHPKQQDRSLFN